ncbi:hypothetical protein BDZ97DRAFT_1918221 [Flammula alnicola]|nr:hypothetical protein BDZ97DRAFT_1918221 [Flammula alnicola]
MVFQSPSERAAYLNDRVPPMSNEDLKCPNGYPHYEGLCMGKTDRTYDDIGRRSTFCGGPRSSRCGRFKTPRHSLQVIKDLHEAMKIYDDQQREKRAAQKSSSAPTTPTKTPDKRSKPIVHRHDLISRIELSEEDSVKIYVYLTSNGENFEHTGKLSNGTYAYLEDAVLREMSKFPITSWTVYDIIQRVFVPIPTFSRQDVRPNEFLILRSSAVPLEKCDGLEDLIDELHMHFTSLIKTIQKDKGTGARHKRKVSEGSLEAGPSQSRQKKAKIVIDLTV